MGKDQDCVSIIDISIITLYRIKRLPNDGGTITKTEWSYTYYENRYESLFSSDWNDFASQKVYCIQN